MRLLINQILWGLHRVLCYVGLHAPERIYKFDVVSDGFKVDGWFCAVCNKTWEEK